MSEYVREITLSLILKTIKANLLLFAGLFIALFTIVLIIITINNNKLPTKYYTSGLIQVNNYLPDSFQDQQIVVSDKTDTPVGVQFAARSQIEEALIHTEFILAPIVERNHLDVKIIKPHPSFILQFIQKFSPKLAMVFQQKGHGLYPNNNESLKISQLTVQPEYLNKDLSLIVDDQKLYKVYNGSKYILQGEVGLLAVNSGMSILVESMVSRSGVEFVIHKSSMDKAVADLSNIIQVEPVVSVKQTLPPITGLLRISILGSDSQLQAWLINDVMAQLKQRAMDQQSSVLSASIEFVDSQIIRVRNNLKDEQSALVHYQTGHDVIDIDTQLREDLHSLSMIEEDIMNNQIDIFQAQSLYTAKHPTMIGLQQRKKLLQQNKNELEKRLYKFPASQSNYLYLKSNLEVDQQLYLFLVNKAQDLRIKNSTITSPVNILNYATSEVLPLRGQVSMKTLAMALIVLIVAITGLVILLMLWGNGDPKMLPTLLDIPLLSVIPYLPMRKLGETPHSIELISSYLLQKYDLLNKTLVVNVGSITSCSGKTFVIRNSISYLHMIGKKSLFITLGFGKDFMSISSAIKQFREIKSTNNYLDEFICIDINILSAMDEKLVHEMLLSISGFDFVFIETLSLVKSTMFLKLSNIAMENLLVISSQDTRSKLKLCMNDFNNLGIKIERIVYNNPKKTLIKSAYILGSYI